MSVNLFKGSKGGNDITPSPGPYPLFRAIAPSRAIPHRTIPTSRVIPPYWNAFLFIIFRIIRLIKQKEFCQKWGLSSGYFDHFPTDLTFQPKSQMCSKRVLNCTYFIYHVFFPIHRIQQKCLNFEKKARLTKP